MIDLSTDYVGLKLKNPLVPSASPLSHDVDMARQLEDAGAAAIVMYSLFEEDVRTEDAMADRFLLNSTLGHAESDGFMPDQGEFKGMVERYLEQLTKLKRSLEIPVVASLNGISSSGWLEFGRELEAAGADALELNIYHVAADMTESGASVERRYFDLLTELRGEVKLPIIMKLSPFFSSLPHFVKQLEYAGARGVSLFNRFYQPDIELSDPLSMSDRIHLSTSDEALLRLRWLSVLHGRVNLTLAATGGVHTWQDAAKMLLAGADVVHMASCLLQHGPGRLFEILAGLTRWMEEREYESVAQLKGSMSQRNLTEPGAVCRANYVSMVDRFEPPAGVWR
ncbi:MAG: dihydroorotate dehydrogenase-like protein [Parasulfuritortus sp.]|jgi:dihydroorotate dehydrogenase (fumarate)|nr:dihydroorotate dehydrogenase-like protein [Parasulfuritortus sp.]